MPSVGDMFFLVHGPSKHGRVAVLFGFFDGCSTHSDSKVWTLCGWLGDESAFAQLDREWNAVLDKKQWRKRPSEFHMYDCVHGYGEFSDWPFAERLSLFGELATAIIGCELHALGSIVITEDLGRLDASDLALLQSQALGTPLDLSLQFIFQQVLRKTHERSLNEEVGILFDEEPPHLAERYLAFNAEYRKRFGHLLKGIGFGDSKKFSPLQAADMLAYSTYRLEVQRRFRVETERDFPVVPGFMRLLCNITAGGGGYDLESLKKLVGIAKAHPHGNFSL